MIEFLRLKVALAVAICNTIFFGISCAIAQITPDGTLPNNSIVTPSGSTFNITGGTIAGGNLFHSFSSFSVPTRGTAFFNNGVDIQNIISRVTGGSISNIDGVIGANGKANVFLINPNGGNINITAGSFKVTNGARLGTITLGGGNAGSIAINARDTVSLNGGTIGSTASETAVGSGGTINISTGSLALTNGALLTTGTDGQGNAGNITINARDAISLNGSGVFSSVGEGAVGAGGAINITTGSLALTNRAQLVTATIGSGNAGNIAINARDTVSLDGVGMSTDGVPLRSNISSGDLQLDNYIFGQGSAGSITTSDGVSSIVGNEGNINITTGSLRVTNGADLDTNNYGQGRAGNITINARDTVIFDGIFDSNIGKFASGASSKVIKGVTGNGGTINITTGSLAVTNGAQLDTSTYGQASAGNVKINARDTVTFDGTYGKGSDELSTGVLSGVEIGAVGTGGDIDIITGSLALTNGAQLIASTFGQGNAGNVRINARDRVTLDGISSDHNHQAVPSVG